MYAEMQSIKRVNSLSSKYMRTEQGNDIAIVHEEMERFLEISKGKIAICRNTTEALDTVIHGINWQKRDEIITGNQDYYSMIHAIEQEAKRNGIKRVEVEVPIHPTNDEEIVAVYENAITSKTRYILLTHIINTTGHILPAKKIIEMAHKRGVQVIVDSAHAVAHFQFSIDDLDPDYLGCSLHKWLGCPIGVGLLYVKKDRIAEIWPLFGDTEFEKDDIRKFWHWGTRPVATLLSVKKAIEFHNTIGSELKEKRLRYLNEYWTNQVKPLPKIFLNTPNSADRYCAIANMGVTDMSPKEVQQRLLNEYKVFTVAIEHKAFNGIRVTPHLYTSINDLDKLVEGIKTIAA
ncbi:MAG: aminotransferase class V-fold PLP-dependent enzyme, partial [Bacteroidetes bacterium]|nr:aminotransferase class V-fold PLP-dependent enzyme [Bacteroidota bacterium]